MRGKYYRAMQQGYTVRITNEDGTVTIQQFGPKKTLLPLPRMYAIIFPIRRALTARYDL